MRRLRERRKNSVYLSLLKQHFCFPLCAQMTKKIKKLEKETAMYRSRWESSNKALLEMAEEVKKRLMLTVILKYRVLLLPF